MNNKMQENGYMETVRGLMCELFDNNVRIFYYYELFKTAARNVLSIVLRVNPKWGQ